MFFGTKEQNLTCVTIEFIEKAHGPGRATPENDFG
jgi:hypothetical protein